MYTLGYSFRPWKDAKAIADGPSILDYVRETAREYGIERRSASAIASCAPSGRPSDARWTVEAQRSDTGETVRADAATSC